uniref:Poly(A) polymerase RNA-binding domain-containing protein n=1 Tax=Meloidogyne incognita TaxID=6306 RepID=A0A914LG69_MELIC
MEWDWQNIVSLDELTNKPLSWSSMEELNKRKRIFFGKKFGEMNRLENHANLIMIVLTPGYPKQNCSFNVNYSTRQIIQKELEIGNNMLINAKNTYEEMSIINNWKKWLNGVNFLDKYKHYLLILCISTHYNLKENVNYCHYVESRIRLELVFSIEDDNLIKYAHAFSKENWLPNEIKQKYGRNFRADTERLTMKIKGRVLSQMRTLRVEPS